MRYFLAGGAVRDILLGRVPKEFDIVFDGDSQAVEQLCQNARRVGKKTATYIIDGHDHMPLAGSIQEDLLARDCTINALLLDANGVIHALPRTFADLKDGIIRHASPESFLRDPVRVFRAARFHATLDGFSIDPATLELMREAASRPAFQTIAPERAGNECMKALVGPVPGNFLQALAAVSALDPWLAPMRLGKDIPAGPVAYHGKDTVFDHTVAVMNAVAAVARTRSLPREEQALAAWMALCHDLGKLVTPADVLPRHIGHESRGSELADALARRLRLPKRWEKAGSLAASLHMKAGRYLSLRPGTRVDLLHTLAVSHLFAPFCCLVEADAGDPAPGNRMRQEMERMQTVTLPEEWRDRGNASAVELRRLRIAALVAASRSDKSCP